jgi:4-aminobutyrate aminotransferase-like enzyme
LRAVHHLLLAQTAPGETAAVVIEPVLGEGGYVPAPPAFLRGLHDICREHGILFVADEVQTGFARTGTMFAIEQAGIEPDVIVMAKGIASGFPISAIGAPAELMARWPKGSHGGTYGGNPIGCAAALATIDVLTEPGFLDHVNARGDQLRAGLARLVDRYGLPAEVRGPGLMVGLEVGNASRGFHDTARVGQVIAHARDEGRLLLMNAGTYGNVVRFMPPLIVGEAEIDRCLDVLDAALAATA